MDRHKAVTNHNYNERRISTMGEQLNMDQFFGGKVDFMGQPHLACALLLDVSDSMRMSGAIHNLNEGIRRFKASLMADSVARKTVDVALVTFNSKIEIVSGFTPVDQMPTPELSAGGMTDMAKGIQAAVDLVKERTAKYQSLGTPCHKPWIFMITDGKPTSFGHEMKAAAERIRQEEKKGSHGRLSFWALGIANYDSNELFELTDRVIELKDADFSLIFDWLADSMTCISQSQVGERVEFDPLPGNARKAEKDRAIDAEWY